MKREKVNFTQIKTAKGGKFHRSVYFLAELRNSPDGQSSFYYLGLAARSKKECETGTGAVMAEEIQSVSTNASEPRKVIVGVETKALDGVSLLFPDSPQSAFHSKIRRIHPLASIVGEFCSRLESYAAGNAFGRMTDQSKSPRSFAA